MPSEIFHRSYLLCPRRYVLAKQVDNLVLPCVLFSSLALSGL